jgi:hypothetical protein
MTQKIMELIDANSGLLRCRVCGAEVHGQIRPQSDGRLKRGNWQCMNGCKLEETSVGKEK